jgi:uncharacterized protein YukE
MGAKAIISADASKFLRELNRVERSKDKLKQSMKALGVGAAAVGAAFVAAGAAAVGLTMKLVKIGEEANTSEARVKNIAAQLGIFGDQSSKVADRILDMANAQAKLTGIDRMMIRQAAAKMLSFRDLAESADEVGGAFDNAMQAALDLSAAGFGSVESAAKALAMAMADPTRGLIALRAKGIVFNEEQREMLKLMHQNGDRMGILSMILAKTQASLGNTANATANATDRIRQSFGILIEKVAGPFADAFEESTGGVMKSMERIADFIETLAPKIKTGMKGIFGAITDAISGDFARLHKIGEFMADAIGMGFGAGMDRISLKFQEMLEDINPIRHSEAAYQKRFEEASPRVRAFMEMSPGHESKMRGGFNNRGSDVTRDLINQKLEDSISRLSDDFNAFMRNAQGQDAQRRLFELREKLQDTQFFRINDPDKVEVPWVKEVLREMQELKKILNAPAN